MIILEHSTKEGIDTMLLLEDNKKPVFVLKCNTVEAYDDLLNDVGSTTRLALQELYRQLKKYRPGFIHKLKG